MFLSRDVSLCLKFRKCSLFWEWQKMLFWVLQWLSMRNILKPYFQVSVNSQYVYLKYNNVVQLYVAIKRSKLHFGFFVWDCDIEAHVLVWQNRSISQPFYVYVVWFESHKCTCMTLIFVDETEFLWQIIFLWIVSNKIQFLGLRNLKTMCGTLRW